MRNNISLKNIALPLINFPEGTFIKLIVTPKHITQCTCIAEILGREKSSMWISVKYHTICDHCTYDLYKWDKVVDGLHPSRKVIPVKLKNEKKSKITAKY